MAARKEIPSKLLCSVCSFSLAEAAANCRGLETVLSRVFVVVTGPREARVQSLAVPGRGADADGLHHV